MTENNIFQEIEDDLQRQRLAGLWQRYGSWVIVVAALIVAVTAGHTAWLSWQTGKRQAATSELVKLSGEYSASKKVDTDGLLSYAEGNPKLFQATLARLDAAKKLADTGHRDKAIAVYDALAADGLANIAFRQLADLRSVELQMADAKPETLIPRLDKLADEKAPWHFTALEDRGYLALRAGDRQRAKEIFSELSQDAEVPETIGLRARDMLTSLTN